MSKSATTKKVNEKKANEATRLVSLPEELDGVEALDAVTQEKLVAEFVQRQEAKFQERLQKQVENFKNDLTNKKSNERELIVRKILITKLRGEIDSKRNAVSKLRAEVKAIRAKNREARKAAKNS